MIALFGLYISTNGLAAAGLVLFGTALFFGVGRAGSANRETAGGDLSLRPHIARSPSVDLSGELPEWNDWPAA